MSSTISANEIEKLSVTGREATELLRTLPGFTIRSTDSSNTAPDFSEVKLGQQTPYRFQRLSDCRHHSQARWRQPYRRGQLRRKSATINYSYISEIQVQTSNFGADQSNGPVIVSGVTKSGTSQYHGSLYSIARTGQLNSGDWFANNSGIAKPDDRYIFSGVTVSGPVPHIKHLTFFGGAEYDAQRNIYAYDSATSAIIHALVPTAGMRKGDFSATQIQQYLGPQYTSSSYNNLLSVPTYGKDGTAISNGNIAPYIDSGALNLINYLLPLPNQATSSDGYNYSTENLVNNNVAQIIGRVDYAPTPNDAIFGRYAFEKQNEGQPQIPYYSPGADMGSINTPGGGFINSIHVHSAAANYVHIFSPTLTNELFRHHDVVYAGIQAQGSGRARNIHDQLSVCRRIQQRHLGHP